MKNPGKQYDIIIAGAGCAGLSLAWYLIQYTGNQYQILIVDSTFKNQNQKTWCFWDTDFLPDPVQIFKSWEDISFSSRSFSKTETLSKTRYHCVRSVDYSDSLIQNLKKSSNITWVEADIVAIHDLPAFGEVQTTGLTCRAKYVFQSILIGKKSEKNLLKQHFLGWEIICQKPNFSTESVMLMDFNTNQNGTTAFMYMLPFSDRKALFEYTVFSRTLLNDAVYENEIEKYLKHKYQLNRTEYHICRVEKGVIPMALSDRKPIQNSKHVYVIGQVSGLTKPTTGYTFSRIHRMNDQIARSLSRSESIQTEYAGKSRFRFYDFLLLHILKNDPTSSLKIFPALFKKNSMDNILRFLDEKTNFLEDLNLLLRLPFKPFMKAIYENRSTLLKNEY